MPLQVDWATLIPSTTCLTAVLAVAIAAATLYFNRRDKRRKIKVKITYDFVPTGSQVYDPRLDKPMLFVEALNPGDRAITLRGGGILLPKQKTVPLNPDGYSTVYSDIEFPYELAEGKYCQLGIQILELARTLEAQGFSGEIKIRGFYRDALDKLYVSKPLKFDVDEELELGRPKWFRFRDSQK